MVEGLIERLRRAHGKDLPAIATGGLAPIFLSSTDAIQHVDPDITLRGLVLIHQRNKP